GPLRQVGLEDLSTRHINELSGGQRQRVFLARALVQEPDLLILDEAFQGVDARSERAIFDVLADFRSKGRTVVLVHHNLATVREFCDDVAILNTEVIASGPVERTLTDVAIRRAYDLDGCLSSALTPREEGHS
ncbi:ATP-binding cassette domain-containing protein, partial [Dermabacter sp. p3-SID358]|uniref:metal ABC transporter ATP-binding protein n=1 Tax=Dermabacter sp. p3-SID358 TaxID=2916114 RepID=UPI0021A2FC69